MVSNRTAYFSDSQTLHVEQGAATPLLPNRMAGHIEEEEILKVSVQPQKQEKMKVK